MPWPAGVPAGALRGQRRLAAGPPGPPPLVDRLRAHPQRLRDLPGVSVLLERLRGPQPHLLAAGPALQEVERLRSDAGLVTPGEPA